MTKKYATLFTGGDGFGIGARAAGLKSSWGVEIDSEIADWAKRNDPDLCIFRADVSQVNYANLETPYLLHASPQCTRASIANRQGESEEDIVQAEGVVSALQALQPPIFTLENVWGYREFRAFKNILQALSALGYKAKFWHLNAADYGVPQTRKRLILVARRDRYPINPIPTHTNLANISQQPRLFREELKPWIGWYEAIEDLIPALPETEFAPWQIERLSPEFNTTLLVAQGGEIVRRDCDEAAFTVTANHNQSGIKALLVPGDNTSNGVVREAGEPGVTVRCRSTGQNPVRAFVVDCQKNGSPESNNGKRGPTNRQATEPIFTVTASNNRPSRALLSGRVVKLTPRALARLQSVPDWYELPENDRLACRIIGNMVPPLLAQRIVENTE